MAREMAGQRQGPGVQVFGLPWVGRSLPVCFPTATAASDRSGRLEAMRRQLAP